MNADVIIVGALGRMGREIAAQILSNPSSLRLTACIESAQHPGLGTDYGQYIGKNTLGLRVESEITLFSSNSTVIIDFSTPESTEKMLESVKGKPVALVIGTTGLSQNIIDKIKNHSTNNAVVFSPNMSVGVNLLFYLTKLAAQKLGDSFDIEIIEAHHKYKKDAPSGTAKKLGEIITSVFNKQYNEIVQSDSSASTSDCPQKKCIGMHSLRCGDIVGEHIVMFAGQGERLELRHSAQSRSAFARGAVSAALWVVGRAPGLYTMNDVLGI